MNIRLSLVRQIDNNALFPLAALIHSYLQNHSNIGTIEICKNEIRFTKGVFLHWDALIMLHIKSLTEME